MALRSDLPTLTPESDDEAATLVSEYRAANKQLAITGAGSKAAIGQPFDADALLSSRAMTGIVEYNPAEMVIIAKAGTPLAEVEAALAENGQMLAFEPPNWGALLATEINPTIGGIAATNLSGPRRFAVGAARDAMLGVRFINGRGEVIKSGGRVMKNVTGLDLVKLLAGSWGRLGLITESAFKGAPRPQSSVTLAVEGADDAHAAGLMASAMATSADVTGAAHLPKSAGRSIEESPGLTVFRLEGFAASITERMARLKRRLQTDLAVSERTEGGSGDIWAAIRDGVPFADGTDTPVWRISTAPMAGHRVVADIANQCDVEPYYDWQGGLVWLRMRDGVPAAQLVRATLMAHGGHATLVRASAANRATTAVFQPEPASIAALSERIAASIDPDGVFNCGRRVFGPFPDAA